MHHLFQQPLIKRIRHAWNQHPWVGGLLVFVIAALLYTTWTAAPVFTDPDSFYHIKITELMMSEHRAITDFPWLPYTTLAHSYVDHHLLYHIVLIPFFLAFGSLVGMKMATVVLAAGTIALFYAVLRSFKVQGSLLWSLLLLFDGNFSFRMGLAKAPSTSFFFLMAGFVLIAKRALGWLALLAFAYVWAYGGFLLLPILAVVFSGIQSAEILIAFRKQPTTELFRQLRGAWSPFAAATGGTVFGLLIHPSFPQHLRFYWEQVVQIGLINKSTSISVGGEWYPLSPLELIIGALLPALLAVVGIVCYFATRKRQPLTTAAAGVMCIFFLIFTAKSKRYIEYLIPWTLLFSALSIHFSGVLQSSRRLVERFHQQRLHALPLASTGVILLFISFIVPGLLIQQSRSTSNSLHGGLSVTRYENGMTWLRRHSAPGDIVFHSDWDDFPILFYQSARNRYIAGLDPTFLYRESDDLYWKWERITTGETVSGLLECIQGEFNARFVVIEADHTAMRKNIVADGRFKRVYSDDEMTIFRVPRPDRATAEVNAATPTE